MTSLQAVELDALSVPSDRDLRRLALATGVVGFGAVASLVAMFVIAESFGRLNDLLNALLAVLAGCLVWSLRTRATPALVSALIGSGAAVAVVGSVLVISGATGFFLAGMVSGVGFGLIGVALVAVERLTDTSPEPSRGRLLGTVAGAAMAVGLVGIPAVVLRLDDMNAAPAWTWIAFIGWLGTFVLLPIWSIRLARRGRVR
jgi:MFS family permease